MALYRIKVTETRSYRSVYVVEAETPEEALEHGLTGQTEWEEPGRLTAILDRSAAPSDVTLAPDEGLD